MSLGYKRSSSRYVWNKVFRIRALHTGSSLSSTSLKPPGLAPANEAMQKTWIEFTYQATCALWRSLEAQSRFTGTWSGIIRMGEGHYLEIVTTIHPPKRNTVGSGSIMRSIWCGWKSEIPCNTRACSCKTTQCSENNMLSPSLPWSW
jgi:hypothetical protein